MLNKLSLEDLKTILSIKTGSDITSMKLVSEFDDDHIACANAEINGVKLTLFWCGSKVVGALDCDDSEKAKVTVCNSLHSNMHADVCGMFDMIESDLIVEIHKYRDIYECVLAHYAAMRKNKGLRTEIAGYFENDNVVDPATLTLTI